jgi:hypothetical protein
MLPDASQIRLVTDDWFELALKARENAEKLAQELSVSRDACHQPFTVRRHLRGTLPLFSGDDSATAKPLLNGLESVATLLGAFQQVERAALVVGGLKSLEGVLEAAVDAEGPAPHKVIAPIASAATKMLNQLSNDRLDRLAPPESISEEKLARSLILLVRFWSYLFFHQMPGLASYDYWFTTIAHLFTAKPPTRIDGCLRDQLVSCLSAVSAFIDHLESRFFPPEHIAVAGNGELSDLSIMTAGVTTRVTSNRKGRRASVP